MTLNWTELVDGNLEIIFFELFWHLNFVVLCCFIWSTLVIGRVKVHIDVYPFDWLATLPPFLHYIVNSLHHYYITIIPIDQILKILKIVFEQIVWHNSDTCQSSSKWETSRLQQRQIIICQLVVVEHKYLEECLSNLSECLPHLTAWTNILMMLLGCATTVVAWVFYCANHRYGTIRH